MQRSFVTKHLKLLIMQVLVRIRESASMVYRFFDKRTGNYGVKIKFINVTNHQLANKLHKPIS